MEFTLTKVHCGALPAVLRTTPIDHPYRHYGRVQMYCPGCNCTWTEGVCLTNTWFKYGATGEMVKTCNKHDPEREFLHQLEEAKRDVASWFVS